MYQTDIASFHYENDIARVAQMSRLMPSMIFELLGRSWYIHYIYIYICIYISSIGYYDSPSQVKVVGVTEIGKSAYYLVELFPVPDFPIGGKIKITVSPQLTVQATCAINVTGSACSTDPANKWLDIQNALPSGGSTIKFSISFLTNPINPCPFSDIWILIEVEDNIATPTHKGNLTLINTGYYNPHILTDVQIDPQSDFTIANTSYKFEFVNAGFNLPIGTNIVIQFPESISIINTPTITNRLNMAIGATARVEKIVNIYYLYIENGYPSPSISADQLIKFEADNIMNPYSIGTTAAFKIDLYTDNQITNVLFTDDSSPTVTIGQITQFDIFSLTVSSLTTNHETDYTFQLGLKNAELTTYDRIKFRIPDVINFCDLLTFTSTFTSAVGSHFDSPNNYSFGLSQIIPANTVFTFRLKCGNPFTTVPPDPFIIWATKGHTDEFYTATASSNTMTSISDYTALSVDSPSVRYPKALSTYRINISTTYGSISERPDSIEVISTTNIQSCNLASTTGIAGTLVCTGTGTQTISITGIVSLEATFTLQLDIRNTELTTSPINFNVSTKEGANYGETKISTSVYPSCDFPCYTCAAPTVCLSCFSNGHEVFGGSTSYHLLFVSGNSCISSCPPHTFFTNNKCQGINIIYYIIYRL